MTRLLTPHTLRLLAAEACGAFVLVFCGAGAVVVDRLTGGALGHVGVSLVFGMTVAAVIYAIGHISGAHINPAVTLAFALARHFPRRLVPLYWVAQLTGAGAGGGLLAALFGREFGLGGTFPAGSVLQSLALEAVLSAILMFVIMAVATDVRAVGQAAALAIGATVGLEALMGGPVSGASMNPARSFGPALAAGDFTAHWVYWAGPIVGMVLGSQVYRLLRDGDVGSLEEPVTKEGRR